MNSDTMDVRVEETSPRQQRWIQEWEQRLDQLQEQEQNTRDPEQNAQQQHELNEDPPSETQYLQGRISDLEWFRASQASELNSLRQTVDIMEILLKNANKDKDRLRGLHLGDLDVDELQQLNSTIQEASRLVQQALERREAEEVVATGQNKFVCPIGIELLKDPVVAADGHTYERDKIEAWFASPQFAGRPVKSPMTNIQLDDTKLIPNHALKSVIRDAVDNKIASMRARERAASPPAEVDESVGTVRTC
jgi:hypothetical protein